MHLYTDEFFDRERAGSRRSAQILVPLMIDLIRPRSVVDVGCGRGTWLSVFRDRGVEDILGIDGDYVNRAKLEIPVQQFLPRDVRQPFRLDRRFDLAVSLEVAEHLPEENAAGFVESLTRLGPVIVFSAAIPFQGGVDHVNEQWPSYWAALFEARGYVTIDDLRKRVWQNEDVEGWYAQNTLVFVDREQLANWPSLKLAYEQTSVAQLSIVHPKMYLQMIEWALHYTKES